MTEIFFFLIYTVKIKIVIYSVIFVLNHADIINVIIFAPTDFFFFIKSNCNYFSQFNTGPGVHLSESELLFFYYYYCHSFISFIICTIISH